MESVIFARVRGNTFLVQCTYPNNSDAKGCVFVISAGEEDDSTEGVEDIMGTINRNNSQGILLRISNIDCYNEVVAFPSGTDIINSVAVTTNITSLLPCTIGSKGMHVYNCMNTCLG